MGCCLWDHTESDTPPGSQASSRGEAKDSALLSSRDAALLEPPERYPRVRDQTPKDAYRFKAPYAEFCAPSSALLVHVLWSALYLVCFKRSLGVPQPTSRVPT